MLIDVEGVLSSPMAKKNGWEKRVSDGRTDRPLYLPPEADKVFIAGQFDLIRNFAQSWEVAFMGMTEPISMSLIARAEGGYAETINGVKVAWVPSDAYFVEVDQNTLGLLAPADRQAISRWAEQGRKPSGKPLSPYLSEASGRMGSGPQAILAIDTTDAIQPHRVRAKLENSDLAKTLDVAATTQLITSLRGVVLEMTFVETVQAVARIDFASPVSMKEAAAKDLVLSALDSMGMSLPETEDWKCSVSGNSITLTGELVPDAARRVFSLMELPTTKFSSLKDEQIEDSSQDVMAKNSLAYFQTIDGLLQDLRKRTKSSTAGDSHWVDRYAAKIDRLPILHVDDDLLEYGEKLSETLHIMSGARKATNLQGASAARSERAAGGWTSGDGYGYGAYSYSSPRAANRNAANVTADATASGTTVKLQGWKLIDEATLEIRREMTKRYNQEF